MVSHLIRYHTEFSRVYDNFKCLYKKKNLETYWRHHVNATYAHANKIWYSHTHIHINLYAAPVCIHTHIDMLTPPPHTCTYIYAMHTYPYTLLHLPTPNSRRAYHIMIYLFILCINFFIHIYTHTCSDNFSFEN